jgi:hypothetical protein
MEMVEVNKVANAKMRFISGLEGVCFLDNTGYVYLKHEFFGPSIIGGIETVLLPYMALRYSNSFTFDSSPIWFVKSVVKEELKSGDWR